MHSNTADPRHGIRPHLHRPAMASVKPSAMRLLSLECAANSCVQQLIEVCSQVISYHYGETSRVIIRSMVASHSRGLGI